MRVRHLTLIALCGICLLTITVHSVTLARHAVDVQREEAHARLMETAVAISQSLDDYIRQYEYAVSSMARVIEAKSEVAQQSVEALVASHPGLLSALVTDRQGEIRALSARDASISIEALPNRNVADREYFQVPQRTGEVFVSPVFRGRGVGNDWIIAVSSSLRDGDDAFMGVLEASLDLSHIGTRVAENETLLEVTYVVKDPAGTLIFSGGPPALDLGDPSISRRNAHGWTIDLDLPPGYSDSLIDRNFLYTGLTSAAVLTLCLGLAWLVAGWIDRPLERLTRKVVAHKPGDRFRSASLTRGAPLEVRRLAQGFDRLTNSLNHALREQHHAHQAENRLRLALEHEIADREKIIDERTKELAEQNRELVRLARAARQAAESKSAFLATMGHEMRTPLAAVVGYGELARKALDSHADQGVLRDSLKSLLQNASRLEDTINAVLDYAALDDGKVALRCQPMDLRELLTPIREKYLFKSKKKGVALELDLTGLGDTVVEADPQRLMAAVDCVVDNAVKFTSAGQVRIAARSSSDGGWSIAVEDTGPGIPTEKLERVTEPFYQADQRDNRRHGGAGLGLAIAAESCRLMGLVMTINSEKGHGTTVTIRSPRSAITRRPLCNYMRHADEKTPDSGQRS